MRFEEREITLKDGRQCILKPNSSEYAEQMLEYLKKTPDETDFLLRYPDEVKWTLEEEQKILDDFLENPYAIMMVAVVDGKVAGTAGIWPVGNKDKVKHRAEFGIGILKEYWGIGLGKALTEACIQCAKEAGYLQLELNVTASNERAIAMYKSAGFEEFGRNPLGFRSRINGFQELVYMRLEL